MCHRTKNRPRSKDQCPVSDRIEESGLTDFAELAFESNSDVQGSYTGVPKEDDQPVQDADDL